MSYSVVRSPGFARTVAAAVCLFFVLSCSLEFYAGAEKVSVEIHVVAMKASKEGNKEKKFDKGLETVREAVKHLKYDTFKKISISSVTVRLEEKKAIKIDSKYSMLITPHAKDSKGRFRLDTEIIETVLDEKDKSKKTKKVLATTLAMVEGKYAILGGLGLEKGVLVVAVATKAE